MKSPLVSKIATFSRFGGTFWQPYWQFCGQNLWLFQAGGLSARRPDS
jgi:hypothetical protein